jgi:hypothetical protein
VRVVAEDYYVWYLFEEDGVYWLDVLVEQGAVSFTVTAPLDAARVADFERDGPSALSIPAATMRHQALMREWRIPQLPDGWSQRALAAVHRWREDHPA